MARPIWKGVITFGMVSIPVNLTTATEEKDLRFNQIHEKCGSRIKQQKFCPVCERTVEAGELKKGYEFAKGNYVFLEEADFEELPVPSKHTIDVGSFIHAEEVDPMYFDTSYYLEPEEIGKKPYALLMKVLKQKGVRALAKVALRQKEALCLIRPSNGGMILETLFFPDEIRKPAATGVEDITLEDREMKMAESLVDMLTEEFEPSKYQDSYRLALLERIEAKIQGQQIQIAPAAQPPKVIDLMEALKASLENARKDKGVASGE